MKKVLIVLSVFLRIYSGFTQERNWFSLPQELSGGSVFDLVEFQGQLVACGTFTMAGDEPVNGIAAWDGSSWSVMGNGFTLYGGLAYPRYMKVYHDSLFVIGSFDTAGVVSCFNVAGWDGNSWFSLGNQSYIFTESIEVFNDELYVIGTFDSIGGIEAKGIAKWTGGGWQNVAQGVRNGSGHGGGRNSVVYDSKLFVSGNIDSAGVIECENIAYWDGLAWGTIPVTLPPFPVSMVEWQDTLLFCYGASDMGSNYMNEIHFWDGINFDWYTWQAMSGFGPTLIFEGELYGGGGDQSYNYGSTVWKRGNGQWEMAGDGLNDWVQTLCEYNGDLYAGGGFTEGGGSEHNYIARYAELNSVPENQNQSFNIYPNPANSTITLSLSRSLSADIQIELADVHGRKLLSLENVNSDMQNSPITLGIEHLSPGIYFIRVTDGNMVLLSKFIKDDSLY